jgi:hypothetical protein
MVTNTVMYIIKHETPRPKIIRQAQAQRKKANPNEWGTNGGQKAIEISKQQLCG